MTIQLSDVRGHLARVIQKWMEEEKRLKPVYSLLLGTIRNSDQYVQSTYLALTQALESYHRIICGNSFSLRSRLTALVQDLNSDARGLLLESDGIDRFVSQVVDMRNYLTHHDENSRLEIIQMSNNTLQMYNLNKRLAGFMTACCSNTSDCQSSWFAGLLVHRIYA